MRPGRNSLPLNKRLLTIEMDEGEYREMKDRLQQLEFQTYGQIRNEKAITQNYIKQKLEIR